ncbi:MAG: arylesterase [Candidatus Didemnitutus sp.]|nr:arylesterase [Candidatus Didemnitutus sp.]
MGRMASNTPNALQSAKLFVGRLIRRAGRFGAMLLAATLATTAASAATKTVLFYGDSITAGYGLDPGEAYPAIVQQKIDAAGLPWKVVNAGLSGETTAGGLRRLDWILRQPVDIFVIELGGNDGLRGIEPDITRANLEKMIERIRAKNPRVIVVLAGMQIPTNMGPAYAQAFAKIYPALAEAQRTVLIPFLLEHVGGIPDLNQADGIHPTAAGHRLVAETVWKTIHPLL